MARVFFFRLIQSEFARHTVLNNCAVQVFFKVIDENGHHLLDRHVTAKHLAKGRDALALNAAGDNMRKPLLHQRKQELISELNVSIRF